MAADALVSVLTDPDVAVRSKAALLLGGLRHLPAVKALRRMFLSDPVAAAVAAAESALRMLGTVPLNAEERRFADTEPDFPDEPDDDLPHPPGGPAN